MKRTIALLLALVMVFALASCGKDPCETCVDEDGDLVCDVCGEKIEDEGGEGDKPAPTPGALTVADFAAVVKDMAAARVVYTVKETSSLGTLTSTYTVAFGKGDAATISYVRQLWNVDNPFDENADLIETVQGTVEYKNGAYSGDMSGSASAVAKLALNLVDTKLAGAAITGGAADGARLTATVAQADSVAVVGVSLPSAAMLSVTLAAGAKSVSTFTLSYQDGANAVEFTAQYQQ